MNHKTDQTSSVTRGFFGCCFVVEMMNYFMLLMLKSYTKKAVQKLDFGLRSVSSQYLPVTVNLNTVIHFSLYI